ncbi:MAG: LCP family protein [Caldilineaceae bacterium]
MIGHRFRLVIGAFILCALFFAIFFVSVFTFSTIAYAASPAVELLPQAQPTALPTAEESKEPPRRPYPVITARVIAPDPKPTPPVRSGGSVAATQNAPLLWEEPVGPASNWLHTENYLVLGTDRRQGAGDWRTDVIMVVGLDRAQGKAVVFSIPRDLYVNIPNYGYGRINQADFLGERNPGLYGSGPQLVSTIISQTLGISTNHWVRFQMDGFINIVDAIGGVTVHLDCPFYEPIFNLTTQSWDFFTLPAGDILMDGDTAYWFVRLRLRESDIGRAARQRQFLWALRDQLLSTNLIARFPELWSAFQGSFATDLSLLQLIELTRLGTSFSAENVHAGGLTLADLRSFTTDQGAAVLGIADPGRVRAVVNGVWEAPAMAATNRRAPEQCAPLPQGAVPDLSSAGINTAPTPEASATVTETNGGQ